MQPIGCTIVRGDLISLELSDRIGATRLKWVVSPFGRFLEKIPESLEVVVW
jgi:hypothetical protein